VTGDELLNLDRYGAIFKPGQSALGHRWLLKDGEGQDIGRTKLFYEGAGDKVGRRLLRATGLSTSGPTHAKVLNGDGDELFRVFSKKGKPSTVEVMSPDDTVIGIARRNELSLDLLGPEGSVVHGVIARESKDDEAFAINDASGQRVAVLSKQPVQALTPALYDLVFFGDLVDNQFEFQATMHHGFADASQYHLLIEQRPSSEPLRTMVGLAPVIAAYSY
jgi:hypothetical protein